MRWILGSLGTFFVNSPLFRLPESLQLDASVRVLDIGCGRGSVLQMLDRRIHFNHPPVGIDFSSHVLHLATQDQRESSRKHSLIRATGTDLPFADDSFDLILCGYLLKHLDDREALSLFEEIQRLLDTGGLALVWEFAPTGNRKLDAWNKLTLSTGVRNPQLRSARTLLQLATLANIDFRRDAQLRPFLFPPIPRASVLVGRPPVSS